VSAPTLDPDRLREAYRFYLECAATLDRSADESCSQAAAMRRERDRLTSLCRSLSCVLHELHDIDLPADAYPWDLPF